MYLVRQNSLYVQYSYFTGSGKIAPRDYFAGSGKIAPRGYFDGSGKIATAFVLTQNHEDAFHASLQALGFISLIAKDKYEDL